MRVAGYRPYPPTTGGGWADHWRVRWLGEIPAPGLAGAADWRNATRASMRAAGRNHPMAGAYLVDRYCPEGAVCADPMIAVGGLWLRADTRRVRRLHGADIEPIATEARKNLDPYSRGRVYISVEDAVRWRPPEPCDAVIFSPPFPDNNHSSGSGDHQQKDVVEANKAYAIQAFGRHRQNLGNQRGKRFWLRVQRLYRRIRTYLKPTGSLVIVLRNHIREGREVDHIWWHIRLLWLEGFDVAGVHSRRLRPTMAQQWKVSKNPDTPWIRFEFAIVARRNE